MSQAAAPAEPLVRLDGASAGYDGKAVLDRVDLTVNAGERIALLGRSGAGKSTLLNLLYARLADRAALIPQAAALVKTLSVFHNVYMGRLDRHATLYNLRTLVWPAPRETGEIEDLLARVGMADKIFAKAGALSGGQQQRVSIARALYRNCTIAMGDEPVSALDRRQGREILEALRGAHETLILVMHDIPMALEIADRIVVLDAGRIVLDAPARTLNVGDFQPYYDS